MTSPAPLSATSILYMALLAIQFGIQPTLTRTFTSNGIIRSTVVLVQEVVKFCLAYIMLRSSGQTEQAVKDWTIKSFMAVACFPAALYAVQNMCALTAYQNLDALTYNVLNQTKTLSAALCCYVVMGRGQSKIQVVALLLLVVAALIVEGVVSVDSFVHLINFMRDRQLVEEASGSHGHNEGTGFSLSSRHWAHGVVPILAASFISGLTGALTQRSLQATGGGRNPYLYSMELCVGGILVLLANLFVSNDWQTIAQKGFFYAWRWSTMIPVVTNAMGGIVVGLVTKHAGSVRKGFALIFGLLFSGLFQAVSSSSVVSNNHLMGGFLAAISLYLHAAFPPRIRSIEAKQKIQ